MIFMITHSANTSLNCPIKSLKQSCTTRNLGIPRPGLYSAPQGHLAHHPHCLTENSGKEEGRERKKSHAFKDKNLISTWRFSRPRHRANRAPPVVIFLVPQTKGEIKFLLQSRPPSKETESSYKRCLLGWVRSAERHDGIAYAKMNAELSSGAESKTSWIAQPKTECR